MNLADMFIHLIVVPGRIFIALNNTQKMVFKNGILFEDEFFYKAISSVLGYRPKKLINSYFEMYQFGMLLEALALCSERMQSIFMIGKTL